MTSLFVQSFRRFGGLLRLEQREGAVGEDQRKRAAEHHGRTQRFRHRGGRCSNEGDSAGHAENMRPQYLTTR